MPSSNPSNAANQQCSKKVRRNKRVTRRGGKKKKECIKMYIKDSFRILHTNIQSAKYKVDSLSSIVKTLNVDLVTVNESHLRGRDKFELEGFKSFTRNRQNAAMGGIATCINNINSVNTLKISEGKEEEYIVTRHGEFIPPLNVINYYGKQESRQTIDEINEGWEIVLEEIVNIQTKGENILLLGDLNCHCGTIIPGNHNKVSHAGKLLIILLEN